MSVGSDPGDDIVEVSTDANFPPCRAFYIEVAGSFVFTSRKGAVRTVDVIAGVFPVGGSRVSSTSTAFIRLPS